LAQETVVTKITENRMQRLGRFLFGEAPDANPPERVRVAIGRQQYESEILIGWVQLAVVVTFGVLYGLSPKTFNSEIMFAPVPWALSLYGGFTLLRLMLAYADRIPGWFLSLSVVIDMSLLMGLIWSFHLQYDQPPSFFLKAPTLLYVFIFVALRALRFDAFYVVLSGIVAGLGWLLMVGYVLYFQGMDPVTQDYVEYMTSSKMLLGAEFDKIISILLVTLILAVAIVRARRLLIRSAIEQTAAADLSRFLPPELAQQIKEQKTRVQAGEGELTEAATLTCDIRGFTSYSMNFDPREIMVLLADYQSRMVPVINKHGGVVDKFPGDGIMVMFNTVTKSDTYAADALRCVDDMCAACMTWGIEREAAGEKALELVWSVAAGPVIFGAVGDTTRLEYTVIGDSANMAAKLEKHTKEEAVHGLTTKETFDLAIAQGYQPPTPRNTLIARQVGGVDEPLDLVTLVE
jgi:adenylate cyclase